MSWEVVQHRGDAARLHGLDLLATPRRSVHVMELATPAVALGSTQGEDVLDAAAVAAVGLDVTRRHSGGGLVVMIPGEMAWVDVVIPSDDPLWSDDVGDAFVWLGHVWADALHAGDRPGLAVHTGAAVHADLGRLVCFAGVGSGEVVDRGAKVVGMSQRRTRSGARFQCLVHRRFDPSVSVAVLAPGVDQGERLAARLRSGVGVVDDPTIVVERFVERLGRLAPSA
ncbi:MAG: hypothetical protein U0Q22_17975 [Acidimicrobiales bacterium]